MATRLSEMLSAMNLSEDQEFLESLRKDFLDEVTFLLETCEESFLKLEDPQVRPDELGKIFRLAHSMKGTGAAVGFTDLASFAHVVEDYLSLLRVRPELVDTEVISVLLRSGDAFKNRIEMLKRKDPSVWDVEALRLEVRGLIAKAEGGAHAPEPAAPSDEAKTWVALASETQSQVKASQSVTPPPSSPPTISQAPPASAPPSTGSVIPQAQSIKIDADRVENVLNIVGELVVIKSQLMNQTATYAQDLRLNSIVSLMDKTIRELQDKTLSMRMTPLKGMFLKTQRIIRDLSVKLGKPVDFHMSGEDTEIDRTMVELLSDPLMHMVRNSLDHGIEKVSTRRERGKQDKGIIHLSAQQIGGRIVVKIQDDGNGIPRDRILGKAIEKGLVPENMDPSTLTDSQVFNFIFAPGFSTAEAVTDVSGRGVGMDVVKTNIEKLKGTIEIESQDGQGSVFSISIPLTTSITDGMIVEVGTQLYLLPIETIRELVNIKAGSVVRMSNGVEVLNHRETIMPTLDLESLLHSRAIDDQTERGKTMLLVDTGRQTVALRVSRVLGQAQVVLKPLGPNFSQTKGIAGAAILGDGKVALVLDPHTLGQNPGRKLGTVA